MNKLLIATLLILNLTFSNAVFLKKSNNAAFSVFNQLKQIESKDFGKKILDTIALQMGSKSPIQDIAHLLEGIRQNLLAEQADADSKHIADEEQCANTDASLEQTISDNTRIRQESEQSIEILIGTIAALTAEIKIKEQQLSILSVRDTQLDEARNRDAEEFSRRQTQGNEVSSALELIIEKLRSIPANNNDNTQVLAELAKIGSSNPILALVHVASTFSQESLTNVLTKLEKLRSSLESSIEEDKKEEENSIAQYRSLKGEIDSTRNKVIGQLADLRNQLSEANSSLEIQRGFLAQAIKNIDTATQELAANKQKCEDQRAKYESEKVDRSGEIDIVRQVESVIATKIETMQGYLKERAGSL